VILKNDCFIHFKNINHCLKSILNNPQIFIGSFDYFLVGENVCFSATMGRTAGDGSEKPARARLSAVCKEAGEGTKPGVLPQHLALP
jgi:hypothetical protein